MESCVTNKFVFNCLLFIVFVSVQMIKQTNSRNNCTRFASSHKRTFTFWHLASLLYFHLATNANDDIGKQTYSLRSFCKYDSTKQTETHKQPAHLACLFAFAAFVESLSASSRNVDELHATIDELAPSLLLRCRLASFVSYKRTRNRHCRHTRCIRRLCCCFP